MTDYAEEVRRISAALFGNSSWISVVLDLLEHSGNAGDLTHAQRIASRTGIPHSQVRAVLARLVDAGLLHALPKTGGMRSTQLLQRTESPVWPSVAAACRVAARAVEDMAAPSPEESAQEDQSSGELGLGRP